MIFTKWKINNAVDLKLLFGHVTEAPLTHACVFFSFLKVVVAVKRVNIIKKKKKKSYSDPPQRPSGCRGWCWCCSPPHQGVFPHTGKHPCQEMSRCGGRFPLLFSEQTCHTFPLWEVTNTVDVVGQINPSVKLHSYNISRTGNAYKHTWQPCRTNQKSCCLKSQRSR